jgi:uncharacterized iron-regulated membrane protein
MRALYVIVGFVPLLLLVTGLVIWQQHRRAARITASRSRAASATARSGRPHAHTNIR